MAKMKKYQLEKNYVQVPNDTAKAVENEISLQALGLIVNLWSYNVEVWELHKTELYKRFAKNKKTSVSNAWDELVEAKYIIEFKYRDGKKWDYVYIYRIEPFTTLEIEKIMAECVEEYGVESTSDFQLLKMSNPNCTPQNVHISNIKTKQEKTKQNNIKENSIPYTPNDDIYNLHLPMNVRKVIEGNREKINPLNIDILEIERFYNTFSWVKENAPMDELDYINQWDFEAMLGYIFRKNIKVQLTTYGLLKEIAFTRIFYKKENAEIIEKVNEPTGHMFYNWLEN